MTNFKNFIKNLLADEEGATAIEYALIAAMVAIVLITFVTPIGTAVKAIFLKIQTSLEGATATP